MARSYIYNLLIMLFVTWTNTQVVCDSVVWSSEWVSVVLRRTFAGSCDWSFDNQLRGRQSTDKNNSFDSDDYFRSSCRNVSHFPIQLDYTITGFKPFTVLYLCVDQFLSAWGVGDKSRKKAWIKVSIWATADLPLP